MFRVWAIKPGGRKRGIEGLPLIHDRNEAISKAKEIQANYDARTKSGKARTRFGVYPTHKPGPVFVSTPGGDEN